MSRPTVTAGMLIRRPPGEVFAAFVNPQTLRKFWLNDASGPLSPGARVQWEFMVPGATETVTVTAFEAPRRLGFDWSMGLHVEMTFGPYSGGATHVRVAVNGFAGEDLLHDAADVIEGFAVVLCDLKTLLESGNSANLVRDKAELTIAAQRVGAST